MKRCTAKISIQVSSNKMSIISLTLPQTFSCYIKNKVIICTYTAESARWLIEDVNSKNDEKLLFSLNRILIAREQDPEVKFEST